jgi:hypothetical protein
LPKDYPPAQLAVEVDADVLFMLRGSRRGLQGSQKEEPAEAFTNITERRAVIVDFVHVAGPGCRH